MNKNVHINVSGKSEVASQVRKRLDEINYFSGFDSVAKEATEIFESFNKLGELKVGIVVFRKNIVWFFLLGGAKLSLKREGKLLFFDKNGSGFLKIDDEFSFSDSFSEESKFGVEEEKKVGIRFKVAQGIDALIARLPQRQARFEVGVSKGPVEKRNKMFVLGGAGLLVILLVSVIFGIRQVRRNKELAVYKPKLENAQKNFEEAKALAAFDSGRSRELIEEANSQVLGLKTEGVEDPLLDSLSLQISQGLADIAHVYKQDANLYLDLSLIADGFKADDVSASDGYMAILYKGGHKLVTLQIANKQTHTLAVPLVVDPLSVASYADDTFVIDPNGLWSISDASAKLMEEKFSSSELLAAYTGNVYVLDKGNKSIWRYQGLGGATFGEKENWFGEGIAPDLSSAKRFIIDGNIWILSGGNSIDQYSGGVPVGFSLNKMPSNASFSDFYTDSDSEDLYLLDSSNSRVVVFSKKGEFVAEYQADKIKEAKHIIVSEAEKKILLISESKIYSIELK